jgi:hypothetical protein
MSTDINTKTKDELIAILYKLFDISEYLKSDIDFQTNLANCNGETTEEVIIVARLSTEIFKIRTKLKYTYEWEELPTPPKALCDKHNFVWSQIAGDGKYCTKCGNTILIDD